MSSTFAQLATELAQLILAYLDQKSLAAVALTCQRLYSVSLPLLYEDVTLLSSRSAIAFFQSIETEGSPRPIYVKAVRISFRCVSAQQILVIASAE